MCYGLKSSASWLLLSLLFPIWSMGQSAVVTGRIVDAETGTAIEGVSVYLMHSLLGSATNSEGRYAIEGIQEGAHTLTISMIGYRSVQYDLQVTSETSLLQIDEHLVPEIYELDALDVTAERPRKWRRQFETFNQLFLGTMPYEEAAQLLNPYVLDFREKQGILTASSHELLVVENQGIGYRILFQLMGFEWNRQADILEFTGAGYFELMEPENERKAQEWETNRSSRGGNYSWLARSNPSGEGQWKARIIRGRCACDEYKYGIEGEGVCRCTYRGLDPAQYLDRLNK